MFFSIIIPAYNRSTLILDTLNSVLSQSFSDWECIVVDDGSTDNTREVVQNVIEKDDRFKYIYQENAERSVARNNGVQHALGEWICFLDSDDLYENEHLKNFYIYIKNNNLETGLLFSSFKMKFGNELINQKFIEMNNNPADYFFNYPVNPSRVCVKKEICNIVKFREDSIIVEDMIFWLETALDYPVYQLKSDTAVYCMHGNNSVNISNNSYYKMLKGLNNAKKDKPYIFDKISRNVYYSVFASIYFGISKTYILKSDRFNALRYIVKSIISDFKTPQIKHRIYLLLLLLSSPIIKIKSKI